MYLYLSKVIHMNLRYHIQEERNTNFFCYLYQIHDNLLGYNASKSKLHLNLTMYPRYIYLNAPKSDKIRNSVN